jgi:prevent-host-death family protein
MLGVLCGFAVENRWLPNLTLSFVCSILSILIMQSRRGAVTETRVAIGTVKRDISELVNRVAYGGERIVLTSRGKPKAALVSLQDYERLEREAAEHSLERWRAWVAKSDALAADILARRGGEPIDVDALWDAVRADREARDADILGG